MSESKKPRNSRLWVRSVILLLLAWGAVHPLQAQQYHKVQGRVFDSNNESIPGVHVSVKSNPKLGTTTDLDGNFMFNVPNPDFLVFSFLGMETQEVAVAMDKDYKIIMKDAASTLDAVVVTGIMGSRSKATFTGAVSTVSGEALKTIGNQNIMQSLKDLDPSFVVMDNAISGSDPNAMANIEVRGQSGLTINSVQDEFAVSPNLPLFILDGFEASMQKINDLDMNRVASITILKDAGSTAIYGSKASNGVVVIETVRPKAGTLQVRYTADLSLSMPDLSGYNMMNASEKLEFERLSGKFDMGSYSDKFVSQLDLDMAYDARLRNVLRGVNTYWLREPVQVGFTNGHSASVTGGTEQILFEVGLSLKNNQGVMKGSDRQTWGGNVNLLYRFGKLSLSNNLTLSGYNATNSPYGNYADWVNATPYYPKYDDEGRVYKYLETVGGLDKPVDRKIVNPLYNATLNSTDTNDQFSFQNNFEVIWKYSDAFRMIANIGLYRDNGRSIKFVPSENSQFDDKDVYEKGTYNNSNSRNFNYSSSLLASYAKLIEKHQITGTLRGELAEKNAETIGLQLEGFPAGSSGSPSFAHGYPNREGVKPTYYTRVFREVNALANLNYAYDGRFLFDATVRYDGSTTFGANKKFKSFWSLGAGWNINREQFMEKATWLNTLKLRANIGTTGNQNIGAVTSSVYNYHTGNTIFGGGAYLSQFGNPNLRWQNTTSTSAGLDVGLLKNRFTFVFDVYSKKTDPAVVNLDMAPSTGMTSLPFNIGYIKTEGIEAMMSFSPIFNLSERIIWTISATGNHIKSEYGGFGNSLKDLNETQQENKSLERYVDGYSPYDIWAVESLGIDPATGQEIFRAADGTTTFLYNPQNEVRIGSTSPTLRGNLGTSFTYKKLRASVSFRYSVGGQVFNSALYDKVENITRETLENNQDRRALYDRWRKPGDIAQYKSIKLGGSAINIQASPKSSRFIQDENYLTLSSASVSWDFTGDAWLKNVHLQSLRLSMFTNELVRWSTVKAERSTTYPFARSVSFTLNATF